MAASCCCAAHMPGAACIDCPEHGPEAVRSAVAQMERAMRVDRLAAASDAELIALAEALVEQNGEPAQ